MKSLRAYRWEGGGDLFLREFGGGGGVVVMETKEGSGSPIPIEGVADLSE